MELDLSKPLYGFFRAKVVDNKDPEKFGRVKVWIPELMPEVEDTKGLWARPGNNPVGGRNMEDDDDHHYMGSSFVPKKGSWLFIFFENGNPNLPYYFGSLDIENTPVLPECQSGNYEQKWVILKSHLGRAIVISDDISDCRVEITGKKRKIKEPPTGDIESVYKIDENQNVILIDEMIGREKILIRTYKGDYIHIDIDEQQLQAYFKNDIIIKTDGSLHFEASKDIRIKAGKSAYLETTLDIFRKAGMNIQDESGADFHLKSGANMNQEASIDCNRKSGANINDESGADCNRKSGAATKDQSGAIHSTLAGGLISRDGSGIADQSGASVPAGTATAAESSDPAEPDPPEGNRDT